MWKLGNTVVNNIFRSLFMAVMLFGSLLPLRAQQPSKLTGTPIGSTSVDYTTGSPSTTANTPQCAFDGDLNSFYASYDRSFTWVGLDLGTPHVITRVGWSPRNDHNGPNRVQLGLFEGSNRADFLDAVPLYLISETGEIGTIDHADVCVSRGFRYVRYLGPDNARCNIAELEFYGYEGTGDDSRFYQLTNLPTLSIHVYSGQEPYDKTHDLESNMTLVYDNGTRIQEYPITTRLRGNASIQFPKKPYRIKFNDGKSHHMLKDSPLESPAKAKKWTLINNYGDKTLMRNILAFEISKRVGMPYTPYCQPVDVIMNGQYKGCYQLCDQITADPNRVPITEMEPSDNEYPNITGGYLVEVDAYASGEKSWFSTRRGMPVTIKSPGDDDITPEQKKYITDYFNLLEDAVFSANFRDSTEGYRKYLDANSFIRHFIVGEFSGNTDTYWSTYMYKERNSDFFVVAPSWDFDLAFNNDNRTYPVCNRNAWVYMRGGSSAPNMNNFVSRILADPYADKLLKETWKEKLASGEFDADGLVHFVDSMAQVLDRSQRLNFIRWPILDSYVHQNAFALGSYEAEVDVLREYIPERIEWITDYLDYQQVEIKDTTIYIASADDLIGFAKYVNHGGVSAKGVLTADIDMEGHTNYPAAGREGMPYFGEFDGQGHVISNLHIKGNNYTGLFGVVTGGAYIHDFTLDSSCSINGAAFVGVVGGTNDSGLVTIDKVGNEADVTGSAQNVSGIFGCNMNSSATIIISNCYNTGKISGGLESATISGWLGNNAVVDNCYNIGEVSGTEGSKTFARGGFSHMNCYETGGRQVPSINASQIADGELCQKLNDGSDIWRQNLGIDSFPVLRPNHAKVSYDENSDTYYNITDDQFAAMPADVNNDGMIAINDVVLTINAILGNIPENFVFDAADMNGDGQILINDVVKIINAVLGINTSAVSNVRRSDFNETFFLNQKETGIGLSVSNVTGYTAMQYDLQLPESAEVSDVRFTGKSNHKVAFRKMDDNVVRVVAVSLTNGCFNGNEQMDVVIDAVQNTEISIKNASVVTCNGIMDNVQDASVNIGDNDTAKDLLLDGMARIDVYDMNGRLVKMNATTAADLQKGIYIINNKKSIVK